MNRDVQAGLRLQAVQRRGDLARPARRLRRRSSRGSPRPRSCSRRTGPRPGPRPGRCGPVPAASGGARCPSSGRTCPSTPARWRPSPGWGGRWACPRPGGAARQRHFSASPPSMQASLDPVVEQPVACSACGEFHRSARMLTQRSSISAVCGDSSRSTMFLSRHSSIRTRASGSIQVPTNVARFSRLLASSSSSSWTSWYAVRDGSILLREAEAGHAVPLARLGELGTDADLVAGLLAGRR